MTDKRLTLTLLVCCTMLHAGCNGGTALRTDQQQAILDLNDRALIGSDKGQQLLADQLLREALRQADAIDYREGQIISLLNRARTERKRNQPTPAAAAVDQALRLAAGSALHADALAEKALQQLQSGHTEQAEELARQALTQTTDDMRGRRLNLLARIKLERNQPAEALHLAEAARQLNSAGHHTSEQANSLRLIGQARLRLGLLDAAFSPLLEALELDKQLGYPVRIAADLELLAEVRRLQGDTRGYEEYTERAQRTRKALENRGNPGR